MRLFLALAAAGILLCAGVTWIAVAGPSAAEIRRERAAIAAWPTTQGELTKVHFQQHWHGVRARTRYYVQVEYVYAVGGQVYNGGRLGLDEADYEDTGVEALQERMRSFVDPAHILRTEQGEAPAGLDRGLARTTWVLAGQPALVYYDPAAPGRAYLDVFDYRPPSPYLNALVLFVFGSLGAGMIAAAALRWRERYGAPGGDAAPRRARARRTAAAPRGPEPAPTPSRVSISPWAERVYLPSPGGPLVAEMAGGEFHMGSPSSGLLRLSNGHCVPSCSPSIVWSDDGASLAVPQWTAGFAAQRLVIVTAATGAVRALPGAFRVLELHAFSGGVVRGVDSPLHEPRPVEVAAA